MARSIFDSLRASLSKKSKWLGKFWPASGKQKPFVKNQFRPTLEVLEGRVVPTILFSQELGPESHWSAPLINNLASKSDMNVRLVFWNGASSQFDPSVTTGPQQFTLTQMQQTDTAIQQLLTSGYLSQLPGGSNGKTTYAAGNYIIDTNPLPLTLSHDAITNEVGVLGLPTDNNSLYVVLTPSGADSTGNATSWPTDSGSQGSNGYNWTTGMFGTGAGIVWSIFQNNSKNFGKWSVDNTTLSIGHEIAECMSSPGDNGYQVLDPGAGPFNLNVKQICDGEQSNYFYRESNGVLVEPYFNGDQQYFVVPDGSLGTQIDVVPVSPNINSEQASSAGYDLYLGGPTGAHQVTLGTSSINAVAGVLNNELTINVDGEIAYFDQGSIRNIYVTMDGAPSDTLTLQGVQSGVNFGDLRVLGGDFKLIYDAVGSHSLVLASNSLTVDSNVISFRPGWFDPHSLEVDGGNCTFTVQDTPSNMPVTIVGTGGVTSVFLAGSSSSVSLQYVSNVTVGSADGTSPGSLSSIGGPITLKDCGNLTVNDSGDLTQNPIAITSNAILYGPASNPLVTINESELQRTIDGGPGTQSISLDITNDTPTTINPLGPCTVSLVSGSASMGGSPSVNGLTVDATGDQSNNQITVTSTEIKYGPPNNSFGLPVDPFVTINEFTGMTQLTVDGGQSTPTIFVDSTSAPTVINTLGNCAVSVCPTSHNLDGIADLTVNGTGNTGLTVIDWAGGDSSAQDPRQYTLSTTELDVNKPSMSTTPSPPWTQLSFSGLGSLNLNLSDKQATNMDLESVPLNTTIGAPMDVSSIINVCPTGQNLDAIGSTLTIDGGGNTKLNIYDQTNPDETYYGIPNDYSFTWGAFTRTAWLPSETWPYYLPVPSFVTVDYSGLAGIHLYAAQNVNAIQIQGAGLVGADRGGLLTPLTVTPGTANDQITVTPPPIDDASLAADGFAQGAKGTSLIGNVTIDGQGGNLTVDASAIKNLYVPDDGTSELVENNALNFTVTNQTVAYVDYFQDGSKSDFMAADPSEGVAKGHPQTVTITQNQYSSNISYNNSLQSLTIDGGPGSTFTIQSTTPTTPVIANGGIGESDPFQSRDGQGFGTYLNVTPTTSSNIFNVGDNDKVNGIANLVTLNGPGTVVVDDSKATSLDKVSISNSAMGDALVGNAAGGQFFAPDGGLDCTGISQLTLNLSNHANDSVSVVPSMFTDFILNGNPAEFPGPGAAGMVLDQTGVSAPLLTAGAPGAGTWTFGNRQKVSYSNMGAGVAATVQVSDVGGAYNGQSFPATATVSGSDGMPSDRLEGVGLTLDYLQLNAAGNVVEADLGASAPTAAGNYAVIASFAGNADYAAASAQANFTISQAMPDVMANPQNLSYGTALDNSQLSGSASAVVNGQWVNVAGTFAYTTDAGGVLSAGQGQVEQVTFTPSDSNFSAVQTTVLVDVAQTQPQLSVNPVYIPVGTALDNSQLSGTATALVGGVLTNVAGSFSYTSDAGSVLGMGAGQLEQVTFTPADSTDFSSAQASVSVNVTNAQGQLVAMDPVSLAYGTPLDNSQLSGTSSAFVNGQLVSVTGSFAYSTAAGTVLSTGQGQVEQVTFTPDDTVDYSAVQTTVSINVYQVKPLVTVSSVYFTYGTVLDNSQLSGTASAMVNGQVVSVAGSFAYSDSAILGGVLGAGQFSGIGVTFTPYDNADFQTVQTNVTINVAKAQPQLALNPVNIITGTALDNSQLSGTATAMVGGVLSNVAGTFSYSSAAGSVLGAGLGQVEQVTFTPADGIDFSPAQTTVAVNVTNILTPQISMFAVNIGYGTPLDNSQLSGTAIAITNGGVVSVAGSYSYTSAAGTVLGTGQGQVEQVTFTPTDRLHYSSVQTTVKVNVSQLTPQVTVNLVNFTYGTVFANSQLSGTATAIVNGQVFNVGGTFTYTNVAIGSVLGAGQFPGIGVSFTPYDTTDFNAVQTSVTVNVAKATPQVAVNPVTFTYGTALSNSQLTGTHTAVVGGQLVSIAGSLTYTNPAAGFLPAGTQSVAVTFTPADGTDFASVATTVQVTVNKATPIITWPTPLAIKYGTLLSPIQLDAKANVAGTFSYSSPLGTKFYIGTHKLTVIFTPTDPDFSIVSASVQLVVLD
jgi:hypothetical protein